MKNPKHDRTHARTPTDLERKYNFGDLDEIDREYDKQAELLRNLNQEFSIFAANTNKTLDKLKNLYQVGSIYINVANTDPATMFGGTWELIAQGHFTVSLERESDESLTQLQETLDTCYVWKRTA